MNQKNSLGLNSCFLDLKDPMQLFKVWMDEAKKTEPNDPNAVALATSNKNNLPSVRMVLLKDFNENGFIFYTNLNSQKGIELKENQGNLNLQLKEKKTIKFRYYLVSLREKLLERPYQ